MKNRFVIFLCFFSMLLTIGVVPQRVDAQSEEGEVAMNVAPSIVVEVSEYTAVSEALEVADVLAFSIDDAGTVVFSDRTDCSIEDLYGLCKETVPAVRIQTQAQADSLADYLSESCAPDFFVLSSSADLIRSVRESCPVSRGIYDARTADLTASNAGYALAGKACAAGAQVILLENRVDRALIEQIQARALLAWVWAGDCAETIWGAATSGCYGVMGQNGSAIRDVLTMFRDDAILHPVYLAGHRGYPKKYNENSTAGVEAAFQAGATHAEIDVHLTADGEVVIMHDATLDRTTNGTGTIAQMTLEEIRRYKIVDNVMLAGQSEIPTLEEMLEILQKPEFSAKLLILEIKANNAALVSTLQEKIEAYPDVRDRLLFITFYEELLPELAAQMPDIPRGFLDSLSKTDFLQRMSPVNAFIDNILASELVSVSGAAWIRDYGYAVWAWTYNDVGSIVSGIHAGFLGLTVNNVGDMSARIRSIVAPASISADEAKNGSLVTAILFNGSEVSMPAEWIQISDDYGVFSLQVSDEDNFVSFTYYTEPVKAEGGGCSGSMAGETLFAAAAILSAAAVFVVLISVRRKRG